MLTRPRDWWVFTLLAALALWQMASASPVPPLWADQHCYLKLGESMAAGRGYTTNGAPYTHAPPGWPLLLAAIVKILGDSELIFVRVSIVLGMAGMMLAYRVLSRQYGWRNAAAAVLVPVTSATYFEHVTHTAGSEAPFMLLLFGMLAAVVWADEEQSPWWSVVLAGTLGAAAVLTRTIGVVAVGALVLWVLTRRARRPWRALAAAAITAGAAAAWFVYASRNAGVSSESSIAEFVRSGTALRLLADRARENLVAQMLDLTQLGLWNFPALWIVALIGIAVGLARAVWQRSIGLLEWLAVLWISVFLLFLTAGGRYAIPILPVLYVIWWRGWSWLIGSRRVLATAAVAVICVAGLIQQARFAYAGPREDPQWNAMLRMTDWMKGNVPASDAVVVQDGLDCIVARLVPNRAFYWGDGMRGTEEERVVRENGVRWVFQIRFTDAAGDAEKVRKLVESKPGLLEPVHDDADFRVFRVVP